MAFVIPLVAAYGAASAAGVTIAGALAGAGGFAAFASVAGGIMASAGMLTGNKTLTKIGSIMSLTGGIANIASSMASGSSSAAGAAAGEVAEEAAEQGATSAIGEEIANTAVGETIGQAGGETAAQIGEEAARGTIGDGTLGGFGQQAAVAAPEAGAAMSLDTTGLSGSTNLMDQYRLAQDASSLTPFQDSLNTGMAAEGAGQVSRIAEAGQQIKDKSTLDALLDKISGAGKWVKDNPELAKVGGQFLAKGYESYQQGQQFDHQMNLIEQRRRRLNSPIAMGIRPVQLNKTGG